MTPKKSRHSTQPRHRRNVEQDEAIGRLIAEHRRKAGLTQRALGKLLDRPHSYVAYVETGQHRLDLLELMTFAKALGFRASKFVEEAEKRLR